MKNVSLVFLIVSVLIMLSCQSGNVDTENKKGEHSEEQSSDSESSFEEKSEAENKSKANNMQKTIVADFQMLIASTGGTYYSFVDDTEKIWDFYHEENVKALEFAMSLTPGSTDHKYYRKTFELTYEERKITRKGETEILPVIIKARELSAAEISKERSVKSAAFSVTEIKNAMFFGNEPFWDMQFYDTYAEKGAPGENKIKFYYVVDGKAGKNKLEDAIKPFTQKSIKIDLTDESGGAIGTVGIFHETCDDGMSENKYPYTFVFEWEDGGGWYGCGRKK